MNLRAIAAGALVAAAAAAAAPHAASRQTRFRSSTDAVLVDVQVTSRGRPVPGLTASDFELRDSGVRQQVQAVARGNVPVSLLLAFDVSASVEGTALTRLKEAARAAVAALDSGDQAALLAYSARVALRAGWTSRHAVLATAIDGMRAAGPTALHDALFTAIALREHAAGRTVMVVFTDSYDTTSWLGPDVVITAARRSDVVVTAVSSEPPLIPANAAESRAAMNHAFTLQRWFDWDPRLFPYAFLDRLTRETGGELLYATPEGSLAEVFRKIVGDFKTRYLLSYTPTDVPGPGWHPIDVQVKGRAYDIRARRGYWR